MLFETEVIIEKVVFKMSSEAQKFAIFKKYHKFGNAWSKRLISQGFHSSMIPTTGEN